MPTIHCVNADCERNGDRVNVTSDLVAVAQAGAVMCGGCNDLIPGDTFDAEGTA